MKILLKFHHGLGDATQLTTVLAHLRRLHPDWIVHVRCLEGKHSAIRHLCDDVFVAGSREPYLRAYDRVYDIAWPEPDCVYPSSPSTKAEKCLQDVFSITPIPELCRYSVSISDAAREKAGAYLSALTKCERRGGRFPVLILHYQGNTLRHLKDLEHFHAEAIIRAGVSNGLTPIILDWDERSPLIDQRHVFCPSRSSALWDERATGDAEMIAALIEQAHLFVGIDSGPGHIAGATSTKSLIVWVRNHPVHYYGLADNVVHLVKPDHESLARGSGNFTFFEHNYSWSPWSDADDLAAKTSAMVGDVP